MRRNCTTPARALSTLEQGLGHFFNGFFEPFPASDSRHFAAPIDLVETPEGWSLTVDLPGVSEEDVSISLDEGLLELTAERPRPTFGDEDQPRHLERRYGTLTRRLRLPQNVDREGIEAELTDGVLRLQLPKKPEARPQRIEIRRGNPSS